MPQQTAACPPIIKILCSSCLFNWLNSSSGNKFVPFSGLGIHFLRTAALCTLPIQAAAADYSWGRFYAPLFPAFETPILACQYAASAYQNPAIHSIKSIPYTTSPYSPDLRSCSYYINSTGPYTDITIRRNGDSCRDQLKYNPTSGACTNDEQKGPPPPLACAGNPINTANGNKFQSETDYQGSGPSTLSVTRFYNSLDGLWQHNYSTYLRIAGTNLALVMAHGRESYFTVSDSTVAAAPTEPGRLNKVTEGWVYTAQNNERFTFDTAGRLTRWANTTGAEQQLNYANGQITVSDNLGQSLTLTEDAQHQPLSLTVGELQITYSYNTNKRLTQLTRTRGGQTEQRQFHYEDARNNALLTGITDERGVRYATWAYDDKGRAVSSQHSDGAERTLVAYNPDGSSTVTNALGKDTVYRFVSIGGVKRVSAIEGQPSANCPNSNSTFTYDERGLLKTKTDNKGHLTTFDYNERGLEVSRTEAAGTPQAHTTATEWHPSLLIPLKVTEPGRVTTYTYDAQGRQLSQSSVNTAF